MTGHHTGLLSKVVLVILPTSPVSQDLRWVTGDNRPRRDVLRHDRPHPDDGVVPNGHPVRDTHAGTEPRVLADDDASTCHGLRSHWGIGIVEPVVERVDVAPGADPRVRAHPDTLDAAVHVTPRVYRSILADDRGTMKEHVGADFSAILDDDVPARLRKYVSPFGDEAPFAERDRLQTRELGLQLRLPFVRPRGVLWDVMKPVHPRHAPLPLLVVRRRGRGRATIVVVGGGTNRNWNSPTASSGRPKVSLISFAS